MAKSESTPAPIPLEDAIKAVQVAMEMEKAATESFGDGWLERRHNRRDADFIHLARATYRSMLEMLRWQLTDLLAAAAPEPPRPIQSGMYMHKPLAAIISHLNATVPDWRTR